MIIVFIPVNLSDFEGPIFAGIVEVATSACVNLSSCYDKDQFEL